MAITKSHVSLKKVIKALNVEQAVDLMGFFVKEYLGLDDKEILVIKAKSIKI